MKILVASPHLRIAKAGGAVFPYSLAEGLSKEGYNVVLLGLALGIKESKTKENKEGNFGDGSLKVRWLEDPVKRGWGRYPIYDGFRSNPAFRKKCEYLLEEIGPDIIIVNSFNRFGTLVECAHDKSIPVVYIACDLGSSCMNEVGLFEISDRRCDGPVEGKCLECQTSQFNWFRYFLSRIARVFLMIGQR